MKLKMLEYKYPVQKWVSHKLMHEYANKIDAFLI